MQFSELAADFPGTTNRLYAQVHRLEARGKGIVNLVRGSVHDAGIVFPDDSLRSILAEAASSARIYRPDPLGQSVAREAISAYEGNRSDRILLTPGTSVSYGYAFRLLAEPGDEILCPTPSYPLFEYIARLTGVTLAGYKLDEARDWQIDFEDLGRKINERTRAIVLISPHNPTGMVASVGDIESLAALAGRRHLAIIADEVFREFSFAGGVAGRPARSDAPLVFSLNGFSKMFALPGLKIGWMSVSGEGALVDTAMRTLEMISDTFLPVNEIAQFSVPGVFRLGGQFLSDYRTRIASLREEALSVLGTAAGVPPSGGFYMVLPYGRDLEDEDLAIELVREEQVLVHPGYLYDIGGHHLVCSFVGDPEDVREGLTRVKAHIG
jgi:hypothetical protein